MTARRHPVLPPGRPATRRAGRLAGVVAGLATVVSAGAPRASVAAPAKPAPAKPAPAKPAPSAPAPAPSAPPAAATQRIAVEVTKAGFVPATRTVKVGQPVTLVVTRTVEKTCARDIVLPDFDVRRDLPINTPVEVTFTPTAKGPVRMTCGMDMYATELVAE